MKGQIHIELNEDYLESIKQAIQAKTVNEVRAYIIGQIKKDIDWDQIEAVSVCVKRTKKCMEWVKDEK